MLAGLFEPLWQVKQVTRCSPLKLFLLMSIIMVIIIRAVFLFSTSSFAKSPCTWENLQFTPSEAPITRICRNHLLGRNSL